MSISERVTRVTNQGAAVAIALHGLRHVRLANPGSLVGLK